jgi:deazaflavin-dependent oxidoreductase (nitroreductase family)
MRDDGSAIYLLSGGGDRSDWVRNIVANPEVTVRIGSRRAPETKGTARPSATPDEDGEARRLLLEKYRPHDAGDLSRWGETALPIVIEPV